MNKKKSRHLSLAVPSSPPVHSPLCISQDQHHIFISVPANLKRRRARRLSHILRTDGLNILHADDEPDETNAGLARKFSLFEKRNSLIFHGAGNRRGSKKYSTAETIPIPVDLLQKIQRVSGLTRFRRAVRKVINGKAWMSGLHSNEGNLTTYIGPGKNPGEKEFLTFNVGNFSNNKHSYNSLSLKAKTILMRPSWLRTEEEVKYICRYTMRLGCFDRYSVEIRKELAKVMYYEKIEKDRVVIREGDHGLAFYFIVSGSVLIEMTTKDVKTGKKSAMIVGKLSSGASFGELALLHDDRRGATVICNAETEFLKVDRVAYGNMLKKNHKQEWEKLIWVIRNQPIFQEFSEASLHQAGEGSNLKEFGRDSVILDDLSVPSLRVNFIIEGCCKVVQKIKLWEQAKLLHREYRHSDAIHLPVSVARNREFKANTDPTIKIVGNRVYRRVTKLLVIRTLKEGEFFGLGEGRKDMSVICNQKTTILRTNRLFFRHHNRGDLARLYAEASSWYPSEEEAFHSYMDWKRWNKYKRNVALEALGLKHEKEPIENYLLDDLH